MVARVPGSGGKVARGQGRRKEREGGCVVLGLDRSNSYGGLHESQTLEVRLKKIFRKLYRIAIMLVRCNGRRKNLCISRLSKHDQDLCDS
jgi:hypothetical protein